MTATGVTVTGVTVTDVTVTNGTVSVISALDVVVLLGSVRRRSSIRVSSVVQCARVQLVFCGDSTWVDLSSFSFSGKELPINKGGYGNFLMCMFYPVIATYHTINE